MAAIVPAASRGTTNIGWLDSRHSFSFGSWMNPSRMGFRGLRVINDDRVAPGGGFGAHGHRDMEIVSYVVDGALGHRDSLGNGSTIRPGDVQRMSAGTGVRHSEMNASATEPVRFLQIWFPPSRIGAEPGYAQKHFPLEDRRGHLRLLLSPDGADESVRIGADVRMLGALLDADQVVSHAVAPGRHAWVQIVRGRVTVDGHTLSEGDALAVSEPGTLTVHGTPDPAEILIFDLA